MNVQLPGRVIGRGCVFYLRRVFTTRSAFVVVLSMLAVPLIRVAGGEFRDDGGWGPWVFRAAPVQYVAPIVALVLGGWLGGHDGSGLGGVLPSFRLSRSAGLVSFMVSALVAVVFGVAAPLLVSAVAAGFLFDLSSVEARSIVEGLDPFAAFAVALASVTVLIWACAVIIYVVGLVRGATGSAVAWLVGIIVLSAFLPSGGVDMYSAFQASLADHLTLLVAAITAAGTSMVVAWVRPL